MRHLLNRNLNGSHALIIRHGEREPITTRESVFNARLTKKGHADAEEFGKTLTGFKIGSVYSSPIKRCIDTGSMLLKGCAESTVSITPLKLLLDAYISDGKLAEMQFSTRNPYELILDQLQGRDVPGFYSVKEGSNRLLNEIKRLMEPGKLTIFVTHDAILMPFKTHFLNKEYNKEQWFPYLGNTSIFIDNAKTVFIDNVQITPG